MEEEDEFGDLYTDVLIPFTKNSSSLPIQNSVSIPKETFVEAPNLKQFDPVHSDSLRELNQIKLDESKLPAARVLEVDSKVNLRDSQKLGFEDPNLIDESQINVIDDSDVVDTGIGDPLIPGGFLKDADFGEGDDDWDSDDSDDGLQIVLNDNNHEQMSMGGLIGPAGENEDEDHDGHPLVIVADGHPNHQQIEEQDSGENAAAAQAERKELGDGGVKVNGVVQPPKTGYGYNNQFHSQFKYMRPGAAPLASGGPPGQLRPPPIVGPIPSRGRGDWRPAGLKNAPPMQKGYGMPVWANNTSGHGFGRGLDFTLPSHKTVFEVDIDSFEEKPWRLPGVDISDFFNFGLNEDSWKDYCKQLEQLRLEATMQSKIRVYESGRTEQDYDPDMPLELAAAARIHDTSADTINLERAEVGHTDIAKGLMCARPQLPTGRAIQVETGYGERLPSIDTRPPRIRDSDAIIEIVLHDPADDDSVSGNVITELPVNTSREELRGHDMEEDNAQEDTEILDSALEAYNDRKRELAGRKTPLNKPVHGRMIGDENSRIMLEAPVQNPSSSMEKTPLYTGLHPDERHKKGRTTDRSPSKTRSGSTSDKRCHGNQKDESAESIDVKRSPHFSSRHTGGVTEEQYFGQKDAIHDKQPDGRFEMDRVDIDLNMDKDENSTQFLTTQKINLQVEQQSSEEVDDGEESKAAESSEKSKAISGSSSAYRNLPDGAEDEVVPDGRSTRMGIKRKLDEDEHRARSKGREEKQDMDRHHMVIKGREDSHYRKSWDSNPTTHHSHLKTDVIDRRKESDNSGGSWLRKDEESHGRTRFDDTRKRDHSDEMRPSHRSKVREIERNDLYQYQLRKQLDNGSWRGYHDKYMASRHGDRDDNLNTRSGNLDDLHFKRRNEDVHLKRDHGEKEELVHVHRENTSRQKRVRDDIMEQGKKDNIARIRNDDPRSLRHKEEIWFPREIVDRQRDDLQRLKQSHEETLSKREREDVRGLRTGRTGEEKSRASHSRAKDELKGSDREYHLKDSGRYNEEHKRKDRVATESLSRHRGSEDVYSRETRPSNDERRSRQERLSVRNDRAVNASDNHRMPEKKHREYPRKSKESEEDHNSMVPSKRNQDDHKSQISERVRMTGMIEQESGDQVIPVSRQSSRKSKEDASFSDEHHESMRGRSKLERWTSHKERDFNAGTKSSTLIVKEINDHKEVGTLTANTVPNESSKTVETDQDKHTLANEKDAGNQVNKDGEVKPKEDKHLDTVAKLKKRSERFKLPMPSEKELVAVKKMENEQLPPVQTESRTDAEIKQERPARKRRWTGN